MAKAGQTRKAIGTAIAGLYAWAQLVITSAPKQITGSEWLVLMGVGVATAACYGLTNDDPAIEAPAPGPPSGGPVPGPTPQGEAGASDLAVIIVGFLLVVVVLVLVGRI